MVCSKGGKVCFQKRNVCLTLNDKWGRGGRQKKLTMMTTSWRASLVWLSLNDIEAQNRSLKKHSIKITHCSEALKYTLSD